MGAILRALIGGVAAFCAIAASAAAQVLSIDDFTRPQAVWSMALSPSGQFLLVVSGHGDRDTIDLIDLRSGTTSTVQSAFHRDDLHIDWVAWKSDERFIFGIAQTMHFSAVLASRYGFRAPQGIDIPVVRILSATRTGGASVQMFGAQRGLLESELSSTELVDSLPEDPNHILLAAPSRYGFSLWRADLNSGRVEQVESGDWLTETWFTDADGAAVLRIDALRNGSGYRVMRRGGDSQRWAEVMQVHGDEVSMLPDFAPIRASEGPGRVYVAARAPSQDLSALYSFDTATGAFGEAIYQDDSGDLSSFWVAPGERAVTGACANGSRARCHFFDPEMARHYAAIEAYFHGRAQISLIGMSNDRATWLIAANGPALPLAYYVYDRQGRSLSFIASAEPQFDSAQLSDAEVFEYAARDGARLWGYLTLPHGRTGPQPLIVLPHGGPEARDEFAFDPVVQFLASRGYAVFQPQFRGSSGFGRAFVDAGKRQWGRLMQDDVSDGVEALVRLGRVDEHRMCIVGASYGGYAALVAAMQEPTRYRCVVSMAGVSDLVALVRDVRADEGRSSAGYGYVLEHVGDPQADRDALIQASPALHADRFEAPVLLIHGEADGIVPIDQSEAMSRALEAAHKQVRFIRVPRAGHPFDAWPQADVANAYAEIERFLAANLGPQPAN